MSGADASAQRPVRNAHRRGSDGVEGARAIERAGGRTLTESEASCVVYGMPRAVREAGLSAGDARIEDMAAAIVSRL